jgi:hypothetical protein
VKGAQWDTWDMEPLSCPKRLPVQLRILLYFFRPIGHLGQIFATPCPKCPIVPMSTNILFYP